jgi:hypothetical protein
MVVAWGGIEGSAASRMDPENSAFGVTFPTAILTPVRVLRNGSIATLLKNKAGWQLPDGSATTARPDCDSLRRD